MSLLGVQRRNLIKKPWAYNYFVVHIRNPNKGPRFLNQVPTLGLRWRASGCLGHIYRFRTMFYPIEVFAELVNSETLYPKP